jgi:hypothetical protein
VAAQAQIGQLQDARWRVAALERNTSLESWMIEQLDAAAAEILGQTG